MKQHVGVVNGGSSSVKWAVYAWDRHPERLQQGRLERVGRQDATLTVRDENGNEQTRTVNAVDWPTAVDAVVAAMEARLGAGAAAVAHRIVHGGARFREPVVVDSAVVAELHRLAPLSPTHMTAEIALLEAFTQRWSGVPQVACFDTAFFADLPREAQLLPLPRRYLDAGVRRYGFHGLSYTSLMEELTTLAEPAAQRGRIVLAHLGNGCSLAAVRDGRPVDASMAFTPAAGLMMGTRPGDLDPGLLTHLMREEHLSADALDDLIHRQCGLLGVSETSADMRDLLGRRTRDARAAEAVALFCRQAFKYIAGFVAVLGGLDVLAFAGGIGEHAAEVRAEIAAGLAHLGVRVDPERNQQNATRISPDGAAVAVYVLRTQEERVLAAAAARLLGWDAR